MSDSLGRPLRVLQFGKFWNDANGGIERHVSLLCKGLAERGLEVVNLVSSKDLRSSDESMHGYRVVQAPSLGKAFSTGITPALITTARTLHSEQKFDVFHFHFPDPLTNAASWFLPRNVPRAITWHSDIVKQKKLLALYKPFLQRETLKADALIAATQAHFDSSTQIPVEFSQSKRHVVPYGMDYSNLELTPRTAALRDSLRSAAAMKAGVSPDSLKIVFALGRHVSYKGFDVLIDAMKHNQGHLLLGGDGPLRETLEQQVAAFGLKNRVTFTGRIPEEDLGAYFHACDVFCLSSVTVVEAFGLVQLEAMACGKPVVCTQLGNGVNVVNVSGVTGLSVPVNDPLALGATLEKLLADDTLRFALGANALEWAQRYSVAAMVDKHIDIYRGLTIADR